MTVYKEMPEDDEAIAAWFTDHKKPEGAIEVRAHILSEDKLAQLEDFFARFIPDCYISKTNLLERMNSTGLSAAEILQNKLPDKGSVMSGDFGEIFTLFYLSSEKSKAVRKIKKWRFKQDRKKPSPHSDVIILYREHKDRPSLKDFIICAEAKVKSTKGNFNPIESSIAGYECDKTGRLARTLVWLKEKALDHENVESIEFIKRFVEDNLDIEFKKSYKATAIIDRKFLDDELIKRFSLPIQNDELEVIVIGIPHLKNLYERSFTRAVSEVAND